MPVPLVQVVADEWTRIPDDAQPTVGLLDSAEKELVWIAGTTKRSKDGYCDIGRHPEKVLAFFDRPMK